MYNRDISVLRVLFRLVLTAYLYCIGPVCVIFGLLMTTSFGIIASFYLIIPLLPYFICYRILKRRWNRIEKTINLIKSKTGFTLVRGNSDELRYFSDSLYIGFDNQNGNLLYVYHHLNGFLDVVGLSASQISQTNLRNSLITIHTNLIKLPTIKCGASFGAQDKWDLLSHFIDHHSGNSSFQYQVADLREEIEKAVGVPVADVVTTAATQEAAREIERHRRMDRERKEKEARRVPGYRPIEEFDDFDEV